MNPTAAEGLMTRQMGCTAVLKPKKLWKVGEVVRHSGLTRQAIHQYCLLGLLVEAERTPSGHRLYDASVFRRLERIAALKRQGKRLAEIAGLLEREAARRTKHHEAREGEHDGSAE